MEENLSTTSSANTSRDWHDTIGEGLLVTATGIGVVFSVLVIMVIFITIFKKIDDLLSHKESEKGNSETSSNRSSGINVKGDIDEETLVVICAAVAAATNNLGRVQTVVLPKIPKRGGNWALQTRSALQRSHNFNK